MNRSPKQSITSQGTLVFLLYQKGRGLPHLSGSRPRDSTDFTVGSVVGRGRPAALSVRPRPRPPPVSSGSSPRRHDGTSQAPSLPTPRTRRTSKPAAPILFYRVQKFG